MGQKAEDQAHGLNINMTPDSNAQLPAKDSQSSCEVIVQGMPFYCCWVIRNKSYISHTIIISSNRNCNVNSFQMYNNANVWAGDYIGTLYVFAYVCTFRDIHNFQISNIKIQLKLIIGPCFNMG